MAGRAPQACGGQGGEPLQKVTQAAPRLAALMPMTARLDSQGPAGRAWRVDGPSTAAGRPSALAGPVGAKASIALKGPPRAAPTARGRSGSTPRAGFGAAIRHLVALSAVAIAGGLPLGTAVRAAALPETAFDKNGNPMTIGELLPAQFSRYPEHMLCRVREYDLTGENLPSDPLEMAKPGIGQDWDVSHEGAAVFIDGEFIPVEFLTPDRAGFGLRVVEAIGKGAGDRSKARTTSQYRARKEMLQKRRDEYEHRYGTKRYVVAFFEKRMLLFFNLDGDDLTKPSHVQCQYLALPF